MINNQWIFDLRLGCFITSKVWHGIHKVGGVWANNKEFSADEQTYTVKVNGHEHLVKDGHYLEIQPIPISEQALIKCGFTKASDNRPRGFLNYKLPNNIYISQVHGYGEQIGRKDGDWVIGEGYTHIEYLHELQNYVKAVYKVELEVRL